jgi:hypothetical protein
MTLPAHCLNTDPRHVRPGARSELHRRPRPGYSGDLRRAIPAVLNRCHSLIGRYVGDRLRDLPQISERVDAFEHPIAVRLIPRFGGDLTACLAAPPVGSFKIGDPKPDGNALDRL